MSTVGANASEASVYYRTRVLPAGEWSTARLLGRRGDALQSLRVVSGKLHATVITALGVTAYETNAGGTLKRYALPGAVGWSSLRVGSDGRARIAYLSRTSLADITTLCDLHLHRLPVV